MLLVFHDQGDGDESEPTFPIKRELLRETSERETISFVFPAFELGLRLLDRRPVLVGVVLLNVGRALQCVGT